MAVKYYTQQTEFTPKSKGKIAKWIKACAEQEGFKLGPVNYIFCSSDNHRQINIQYLGHDYNTDVISFDYSDLTGRHMVSGDIFIDPETVRAFSVQWQTTPDEELMRVIVHGVLHLCGYKDKTDPDSRLMRQKENQYLELYGNLFGAFRVW